jgi:hypothetical protein
MSESITLKQLITHAHSSLAFFIAVCCILPIYCGSAVTMIACASVMSAYVSVITEQFRSRSGSLKTAACLVMAMWTGVAVITAMTLSGELRS